jgi:hypothetical protein
VVTESAEQQRANFLIAKQRHQQVAAEEAAFARAPTRPAPIWSAKPGDSHQNKDASAAPAVKAQKAAAWDAEVPESHVFCLDSFDLMSVLLYRSRCLH